MTKIRLCALGTTVMLALGGCSQTRTDTAAKAEEVAGAEVGGAEVAAPHESATTTEPRRLAPAGVDDLAYLSDQPAATSAATSTSASTAVAPTTTSQATTVAPDQGGGPATTGGSGRAPVTTTGAGNPVDPGAIYQGIVGSLGSDDIVVAAVVPPPQVGPGVQPLTGLAGDVPNRPAAVVKVDNGSRARPQTGLNAADIVVEEEVEGGITRFAAIFHSTESIVGPVRSGRTTDIGVLVGLGSPLLMYSGANEVTDALLLARTNVQNRNAGRSSGYWRSRSRQAPSNLYTDTAPHRASASGGPPPAQFAYRDPATPSSGDPASSFTVSYRSNRVGWEWDGASWLRSQGGRAHTVASGARVSAANVVVVETQKVDTGMVDSSGAEVPEFVFVGTGRATVFSDGKKTTGVWTRPSLASVATLSTSDGAVIELTPGRTWIELIQADVGMLGG